MAYAVGQYYACAIAVGPDRAQVPTLVLGDGPLARAGNAGVRLAEAVNSYGQFMGNPLWEFSLATYRVEGVAESCLALQDRIGLDVNQLLYAAWLAGNNQCLSEGHLAELDGLVAEWRTAVIKPLRGLRRQLQGYSQAARVREELKGLELKAERAQQDMMYAFHQRSEELVPGDNPLLANLITVALLANPNRDDWDDAIRDLASVIAS